MPLSFVTSCVQFSGNPERRRGKGRRGLVSKIDLRQNDVLIIDVVGQRILIRSNVKCRVVQKAVVDSCFFINPSMEVESGGGALISGMGCASFEQIMMNMLEGAERKSHDDIKQDFSQLTQ
mmetsp:Transcript_25333/g.37405  ORF Transcript_25333/g.37405 Transcript_25333/m.37405 type:complete len:121 (-) Transcript_25333:70-432(-)